jgi:hypothetical protein
MSTGKRQSRPGQAGDKEMLTDSAEVGQRKDGIVVDAPGEI